MKWIISFLWCLTLLPLHSQSLIPNGDFELIEGAQFVGGEAVAGTPDVFNLNNIKLDFIWQTNRKYFRGVKSKGFMGFAFSQHDTEVLGTELNASLESGVVYELTARVLTGHSCAVGFDELTIGLTSEKLEASKLVRSYEVNAVDLTSATQFIPGESWTTIRASYEAQGGEQYLSIGNFNGANAKYFQNSQELMVEGQKHTSCNYLIVDEIRLEVQKDEALPIEPIVIEDIAFEFGSWELTKAYEPNLLEIANSLKRTKGAFAIIGHTDNVGSTASNQSLSLKRANEIKEHLAAHGIDEGLMRIEGRGESVPKDSNESAEGRQKNRRVEIVFN